MLGSRGTPGWCAGVLLGAVGLMAMLAACSGKSSPSNGVVGQGGDGTGGQGPSTASNVIYLRETSVDKIDLLLTVDNSSSMKDKQQLLAQALPLLISRLITPRCIRQCTAADNCTPRQQYEGMPVGGNADAQGKCASGLPEMAPVRDLHLAVISSSLGAHGAHGAKDLCTKPSDDDHAHLLGQVRQVPGTFQDLGFLAWNVMPKSTAGGDTVAKNFLDKAVALVDSAGENGCELESTLEAWYRFLIDPEPPASVVVAAATSAAIVQGVDDTVLQQRAAFLRPDSVVVIGMLSDENDCSVVDEGYGWLTARTAAMFGATSACATNPNDVCCQSCGEVSANPGCPSIAADPACTSPTLAAADDAPNLRCWHQKSRFGFDLLYPISRYVEGLTRAIVNQRSTGTQVPNPLFAATAGKAPRDRGLVQVFGIVGVPWQDIADDESVSPGTGLTFLTAPQLTSTDRWRVVLGRPEDSPPTPPTDPFMLEEIAERTGQNPVSLDALAPSTAKMPNANAINGHEHANVDKNDLQYACTFKLPTPRKCDAAAKAAGTGCDCFEEDAAALRPLCQSPTDGSSGTTQSYAKAYPGTRFLQLFKELENPVVASICPKVMDQAAPDYGYNPAIDGLMQSVRNMFIARCLPVALPIDDRTAQVDNCSVVTSYQRSGNSCDCESHGWDELTAGLALDSARAQLRLTQTCGDIGGPACTDFCFCQIPQLEGVELQACQNDLTPPETNGFCYINAQANEPNVGNPDLVRDCSADAHRHLRFLGEAPNASEGSFIICDKPLVAPARPTSP